MRKAILAIASLLLAGSAISAGSATQTANLQVTTQPSDVNQGTVEGSVKAVSMTTIGRPEDFLAPGTPIGLSEKDPNSAVIILLEGQDDSAFIMLTGELVKLDGFKDLDAKHEIMGGLLILSEIQHRLVGQKIALKCRKIASEGLPQLSAGAGPGTVFGIVAIDVLKHAQTTGQGIPPNAATAQAAGSGVEYQMSSPTNSITLAFVFLGQEGDGYWKETRTRTGGNYIVIKEFIDGESPKPKISIVQSNGAKPIELIRSSSAGTKVGAWLGSGSGRFFLEALAGAMGTMQTNMANREVRQAARPIHTDAERLQYASRQSTEIHPPVQPILPAINGTIGSPPTPTTASISGAGVVGDMVTKIGTESVTVPAGTFECDHYTFDSNSRHFDLWLSSKETRYGYYGLIKRTSTDGESMELQKILENETSQIKGEPTKVKVPAK